MAQYAYPRSTTNAATAYTSTRSSAYQRRRAIKTYGPPLAGAVFLLWFLLWLFSGSGSSSSSSSDSGNGSGGIARGRAPAGTAAVVIVTALDPSLPASLRAAIEENRRDYAARHGYATFFPNTTDYDLMAKTPASWSSVPALRHAMTLHPHTPWLWWLAPTALIMDPRASLAAKVLAPHVLETLMEPEQPVVPPDSVIHTFAHLRPSSVDLVLAQDHDGLAPASVLLRSGDWAKFFLDAWYDPLYRSYNFQRAERHALEHIVQWHGTILSRLALVPQRVLNSYTREVGGSSSDGIYQEGDFVANCHGCDREVGRNCESEMAPLLARWRELRDHKHKRR